MRRMNAQNFARAIVHSVWIIALFSTLHGFAVYGSSVVSFADPQCDIFDGGKGTCNHKDSGSDDEDSRSGTDDTGNGGGSGSGGNDSDSESNGPSPGPRLVCDWTPEGVAVECPPNIPDPQDPPPGDDGGSVAPPIPSESDFASFQIPPSTPHALPTDWTVTGKPTAFWADAGVKEFNEQLLGFPLRIRATPVEFHWDFGDGSSTSSKSPGREPARPEHGRITHIYSEKGNRTVTLTTVYSGEYNYGAGWSPIPGTAAVESDGLPMTVYRYHKYRVEDDCNENPYGIDCTQN